MATKKTARKTAAKKTAVKKTAAQKAAEEKASGKNGPPVFRLDQGESLPNPPGPDE